MGHLLRQLPRLAFHATAAFSACALLFCFLFWPLSYCQIHEAQFRSSTTTETFVIIISGRIALGYQQHRPAVHTALGFRLCATPYTGWNEFPWTYLEWRAREPYGATGYLGIAVFPDCMYGPTVFIPFSYLTLLSAILPALWLRRFRRRRLARRGFPVECSKLPPADAAR